MSAAHLRVGPGASEPWPYIVPATIDALRADLGAHLAGEHPRPVEGVSDRGWKADEADAVLVRGIETLLSGVDRAYQIPTRNIAVFYKGELHHAHSMPLLVFLRTAISWWEREREADWDQNPGRVS